MSDMRDLQIQVMLQQGMTQAAIAEELGLSRERVRQLIPKEVYDELPQRGQRYDPVRDARVREAGQHIENGSTQAEAAKKVGLSQQSLAYHLRKLGLATTARVRWTDSRCALIQQRIDAGESHADIAADMGIAQTALNNGLVCWRKRTGQTHTRRADWSRVYKMHRSGMTRQQIADALGCTYSNVSHLLRRMQEAGYAGGEE